MPTPPPANDDFNFDAAADEAVRRGTASLSDAVKAGARDGVIAAFKHLGLAALIKGSEPDGDEGGGAADDERDGSSGDGADGDGADGDGSSDGADDPENDPANGTGADDMMMKGEIDVTKLIAELAGVPAALQKLDRRVTELAKGMATKGEIAAVATQVAELAKGTAAGVQQLLVAQGDTATRLVEQPGRANQPRTNPNTGAQRAGESGDGSKLTSLDLAKAMQREVITPLMKRTYDLHGRFCTDDAENAAMEAKVREAAANYKLS